jgi:hypothetical protein
VLSTGIPEEPIDYALSWVKLSPQGSQWCKSDIRENETSTK